jgi:hypothetical protein
MRPRDPQPRVRLRAPDASVIAVLGALAQAACTHAEPAPPVLVPEPAPRPPPAPPVAEPQPGAVVILGPDPTVGRVRVVEPDGSAPYYRVGDYRTRVGPRWYSRATGQPVRHDDEAFQRWLGAQRQAAAGGQAP